MNGCLQLNSQPWKLQGSNGLKLLPPRQDRDDSIYFEANWSFIPPDVEVVPLPPVAPQLRLRLNGCVPGLRDWRDLENLFLGYHEPIDGKEPAASDKSPDTRGPDMWLWLPGETKALRYGTLGDQSKIRRTARP